MEGQEVGAFELEVREEAAEQEDGGFFEGEESGEEQTQEVTYAVFEFDAEKVEGADELVPDEEQEVTLVIARSADPQAPGAPGPAFANRALAEEGGYAYEAVPGTGHLLQVQKPEECRRAMLSFLDAVGVRY